MANIHGIALFSGGLDSLLAARLMQAQDLSILCVHFTSPFFGSPQNVEKWRGLYNLDIIAQDISQAFVQMLVEGPTHGFGKTINPCVDCKILMLKKARELLEAHGARFLISGEVLGQRPMSQRRDAMDIIKRDSEVGDLLLRPLCALHCAPTPPEESGLVNRAKLCGFSGRTRTPQLELAKKLGLENLPSPAGGCVLTELENGRRYWPILKKWRAVTGQKDWNECADDFRLARLGRQFWRNDPAAWLIIGRQQSDNAALLNMARDSDITMKISGFPGPIALCSNGAQWQQNQLREAAQILASHSARAVQSAAHVTVSVLGRRTRFNLRVLPDRHEAAWTLPDWETTRKEIRASQLPVRPDAS